MPIIAERGYVIPAFNTDTVDYVSCAEHLAASIKSWHPDANVTILRNEDLKVKLGGYADDCQVYHLSPYRQTIKLEADMVMSSPCDHWWTMFEHRDVVVSVGARNIYDQPATSRRYRKLFDANNLPDVYNAVTYWRVSQTAVEFWRWVRVVFDQWDTYKTLLKFPDEMPTTDVVYAIVAQIIGPDRVTLPTSVSYPKIVHMKPEMIFTSTQDWTDELVWEYTQGNLRLNTVSQIGPVHYNVKTWNPYG